jgi:hypothetical protein
MKRLGMVENDKDTHPDKKSEYVCSCADAMAKVLGSVKDYV